MLLILLAMVFFGLAIKGAIGRQWGGSRFDAYFFVLTALATLCAWFPIRHAFFEERLIVPSDYSAHLAEKKLSVFLRPLVDWMAKKGKACMIHDYLRPHENLIKHFLACLILIPARADMPPYELHELVQTSHGRQSSQD